MCSRSRHSCQRARCRARNSTTPQASAQASIRAKVEHPFRVIKRQFGYTKVRYRGLKKNTLQLKTLFALSNLWMVRHQLLGAKG